MIKILVLQNGNVLISQIEEEPSELGEPDCKLIKPFIFRDSMTIEPWMVDYTSQDSFMIHSDKILTIVEPKHQHIKKYEDLIK
jgi:hypothetical protein